MKPVVVLGVTGSVAAYRAADLAREMMRDGMEVRACLSRAAQEFVTPALFEALTGGPCLTHAFDEPVRGRMAHIDWARDAACIVICPATTNAIAKLAHGEADDMLTTIAAVSTAELVVAPAMNPQMFASPANRENLDALRRRGAAIVEPAEGEAACGEQGQGKLAAVGAIMEAVRQAVFRSSLYDGKRVLITAGPTYEPIDPVRFLGNRSSGKMGYALADAAQRMGAQVSLITGPTHLLPPPSADVLRVLTATEMLDAVLLRARDTDMLISAAAVSDFHVEKPAETKIKRRGELALRLVPNPDMLSEVRKAFPSLFVVGFAAETSDHVASAEQKLAEKGLAALVLNDVSRTDIGFDSDWNEVTLFLTGGERRDIPRDSKFNVALRILETLRPRLA